MKRQRVALNIKPAAGLWTALAIEDVGTSPERRRLNAVGAVPDQN